MAKMVLDGYTFAVNPLRCTPPIEPKKAVAGIQTYSDAAVFEWEATFAGITFLLEWNYMSKAQFDALAAKSQAMGSVVWDPKKADAKTYNVAVRPIKANPRRAVDGTGGYFRNVRLSLFCTSEV